MLNKSSPPFLLFTPRRHYLREWREKRGLTQEELGKFCGTTGTTISRYETGERGLPIELMYKFFDTLDILPGQLFAPPETPSLDAIVASGKWSFEEAGVILKVVGEADVHRALLPELLRTTHSSQARRLTLPDKAD